MQQKMRLCFTVLQTHNPKVSKMCNMKPPEEELSDHHATFLRSLQVLIKYNLIYNLGPWSMISHY